MTAAGAPDLGTALDFSGRCVLVTGGTKGLGRAIAQRFGEAGAVVVCGRHEPESGAGNDSTAPDFVAADVRDADSVAALFAAIADRHGRLDVLVNNAGGSPPADTATASANFTNAIVGLNLVAPLLCAQAAFAQMREQAGG